VFTRIVVAYDHTPRAQRVLDAGVQMARGYGAELIAVAVERGLLPSGNSITEVQDAHRSREQACIGWLSAALAYADEHGVPLRTEIRIGVVAQQLAAAAAAHRADLLILGRSDRNSVTRRLLGTTADKVSRHVRCPVMIIP
jgi:nucleotide-binding universal stress UspA family protein